MLSQPRGIHGNLVEILASRIVSNEYPEGKALDLPTLCAEFDISNTALREAVRVLSAKGMIVARPKLGTIVQPMSSWHILDLNVVPWATAAATPDSDLFAQWAEFRALLEPAAARKAAERATESDITKMESALKKMTEAADINSAVTADITFHCQLLLATHNEFPSQIAQIIEQSGSKRHRFTQHASMPDLAPSHSAVLDAVRNHDPAAAEHAMRALVDECLIDKAASKQN